MTLRDRIRGLLGPAPLQTLGLAEAAAVDILEPEEKAALPFTGGASGYPVGADEYDLAARLTSLLKPTTKQIDFSAVDATFSSAFCACLNAYRAVWPEAPLEVQRSTADGWESEESHPLVELLARPSADFTIQQVWASTLCDRFVTGMPYWRVDPNARGVPAEIHPVPSAAMRPRWPRDGSEFISHYEQNADGRWYRVEKRYVVAFRNGINWRSGSYGRLGIAPIEPLRSTIFVDDEAESFMATVLANMGVPGVIFTPKGEVALGEEQRKAFAASYQSATTGAKRGRAILFHVAMELQRLGFSPEEINMERVAEHCEARISAVLRVPAAIAGFKVGLDASGARANFQEAQRQFWENGVGPLMVEFAEVLTHSLLPLFPNSKGRRVVFNVDRVKALQEDETAKIDRVLKLLGSGVITINEARTATGFKPDAPEAGDVYLVPSTAVPVRFGAPLEERPGSHAANEAARAYAEAEAEKLMAGRQRRPVTPLPEADEEE